MTKLEQLARELLDAKVAYEGGEGTTLPVLKGLQRAYLHAENRFDTEAHNPERVARLLAVLEAARVLIGQDFTAEHLDHVSNTAHGSDLKRALDACDADPVLSSISELDPGR